MKIDKLAIVSCIFIFMGHTMFDKFEGHFLTQFFNAFQILIFIVLRSNSCQLYDCDGHIFAHFRGKNRFFGCGISRISCESSPLFYQFSRNERTYQKTR